MNRQVSKEKKMNLLPKKSSSRSLKKEKISKLPSYYQQYLNESETEMLNVKTRKNSNISENKQIITKEEKILTPQPSSINQKRNSSDQQPKINNLSKQTVLSSSGSKQISMNDQRQINDTDNPTDMMVVIESHSPSNMSELSKPSTTSYQPSKIFSKTSYFPSQKGESYESKDISFTNKKLIETPSSSSYKNEHKIITSNQSISIPPTTSRTTNDIPKRRSQSVSSSRKSSNISKDQSSQQIIKTSSPSVYSNRISYTSNPSISESHLSNQLTKTSTSNKIPIETSSISPKQKNFQRPQVNITDSATTEYDSQPNIQNISA